MGHMLLIMVEGAVGQGKALPRDVQPTVSKGAGLDVLANETTGDVILLQRDPTVFVAKGQLPINIALLTPAQDLCLVVRGEIQRPVQVARLIETELGWLNLPITNIAAITACVSNGLGVSVVPRIALADGSPNIVSVPFDDPPIFRQVGLVQRHKSIRAALIDEFHYQLAAVSGAFGVARS